MSSMNPHLGLTPKFRTPDTGKPWEKPTKGLKIKRDEAWGCYDLDFLSPTQLILSNTHRGAKGGCVQVISTTDGSVTKTLRYDNAVPYGVSADSNGRIAIATVSTDKEKPSTIKVLEGTEKVISEWSDKGSWSPKGVTLNKRGQVIVTNIEKKRHSVGIYTFDGKPYIVFGTKGKGQSQLDRPNYVNVDMYDRILVSDYGNNCIKVFDQRGHTLGVIGRDTKGAKLSRPRGVCSDSRGNIIVADEGNKRVSVHAPDGRFIQHLLDSSDGMRHPHAIAVHADGMVATSQHTSGGKLQKLRMYHLNGDSNASSNNNRTADDGQHQQEDSSKER